MRLKVWDTTSPSCGLPSLRLKVNPVACHPPLVGHLLLQLARSPLLQGGECFGIEIGRAPALVGLRWGQDEARVKRPVR